MEFLGREEVGKRSPSLTCLSLSFGRLFVVLALVTGVKAGDYGCACAALQPKWRCMESVFPEACVRRLPAWRQRTLPPCRKAWLRFPKCLLRPKDLVITVNGHRKQTLKVYASHACQLGGNRQNAISLSTNTYTQTHPHARPRTHTHPRDQRCVTAAPCARTRAQAQTGAPRRQVGSFPTFRFQIHPRFLKLLSVLRVRPTWPTKSLGPVNASPKRRRRRQTLGATLGRATCTWSTQVVTMGFRTSMLNGQPARCRYLL